MRDILFRGKRIDNGEWVEGGIIPLDIESGYLFIAEPYLSTSTLPVYEIVKNYTHLVIPETVEYNGVTYYVISVGKINEDGLFTDGAISLSGEEPKTVNIPESVIFIWDKALCFDSVESYLVDADNQVYSSDDGVLFTKSGYTLIAYPGSRAGVEYTIPDETCIIAYNAFEKCAY